MVFLTNFKRRKNKPVQRGGGLRKRYRRLRDNTRRSDLFQKMIKTKVYLTIKQIIKMIIKFIFISVFFNTIKYIIRKIKNFFKLLNRIYKFYNRKIDKLNRRLGVDVEQLYFHLCRFILFGMYIPMVFCGTYIGIEITKVLSISLLTLGILTMVDHNVQLKKDLKTFDEIYSDVCGTLTPFNEIDEIKPIERCHFVGKRPGYKKTYNLHNPRYCFVNIIPGRLGLDVSPNFFELHVVKFLGVSTSSGEWDYLEFPKRPWRRMYTLILSERDTEMSNISYKYDRKIIEGKLFFKMKKDYSRNILKMKKSSIIFISILGGLYRIGENAAYDDLAVRTFFLKIYIKVLNFVNSMLDFYSSSYTCIFNLVLLPIVLMILFIYFVHSVGGLYSIYVDYFLKNMNHVKSYRGFLPSFFVYLFVLFSFSFIYFLLFKHDHNLGRFLWYFYI